MAINPNRTKLDQNAIFQRCMDEPNDRIRVDAEVTASIAVLEVTIDSFSSTPPDNILIVGTEDGTLAGTKHVALIDSNLDLHVVTSNFPLTVDTDYGTVSLSTIRTASQIGNATGAADFDSGITTPQTLRVVLPTDQTPIPVSQFGVWTISTTNDTNYGIVGVNTLRTASQIGNATGAADFNAGVTGAQTLRTHSNQGVPNIVANSWPILITDGIDTAKVTVNSDLSMSDGLRNGGVYGNLSLTTGDTAYEAKVGGSALSNRKSLTITALNKMFWGYDSSVTTLTGTPLYKNQQIVFAIDPDSTFQVWVVSSTSSSNARITEST